MLETQKALQRFAKHVVSQSRANLTRGKKRASNGLYDSIGYDLKVHKQSFSLSFVMEEYGMFVDRGVRGSNPSLVKNGKQKAPLIIRTRGHRLEGVIHVERWGIDRGATNHDGGHARHAGMWGDVLQDNGASTNLGAFADGDVAEDLRAGADEHARTDLRVTVATGLAGATQGDLVEEGDVVGDDAGLAGDEAGGVVEQDADAEAGRGMDIDGEVLGDERLQVRGKLLPAGLPERVRQTMRRDGVEALVPEIRDQRMLGRRIALEGGADVGAHLRKHFAVGSDGLAEDAEDDGEVLAGGRDPFRQALDDALAETGTVEDIAMEHRRQGRFGLGDDGRAGLQLRPEGNFVGADQGDGTGVSHRQEQ